MTRFLGVIGMRGELATRMTWFGSRRLEPRRTQSEPISVVSVVSALQSELRTRRRRPGVPARRMGL
jgi:hypothetical protein